MGADVVCLQCREPISGIHTDAYAVGWCRNDIHLGCMALHVRSCRECYPKKRGVPTLETSTTDCGRKTMKSAAIEGSIFPELSLDRSRIHWEDYIHVQTPVEQIEGMLIKRDDLFAPLGAGGINGGKVRQILWVLRQYQEIAGSRAAVIMAGSVKSPQIGRVPTVAKHLGIPITVIIAADPDKAAARHQNVEIAKMMGAKFVRTKVGYNPALQAAARKEHQKHPDAYLLEYALSVQGTDERIESFYRFCAEQVENLPDVQYILAPAGSCNTAIGLLYGIAMRRPKRLKEVHLFGIAPSRRNWYEERLLLLEKHSGVQISKTFARSYDPSTSGPYALHYHDLNGTGFATWETLMPASLGSVVFHPRYEGKIWTYLQARREKFGEILDSEDALFWLVGTDVQADAMRPYAQAVIS